LASKSKSSRASPKISAQLADERHDASADQVTVLGDVDQVAADRRDTVDDLAFPLATGLVADQEKASARGVRERRSVLRQLFGSSRRTEPVDAALDVEPVALG
jgi:hypothetical protein